MIRWPLMCAAAVALVLLPGCNQVADRGLAVEHHLSDEAAIGFDLEPLPSGDGSQQWIGIYNSSGKIARFRIDFGAAESTPGKTAGESGVKSGEGALIPEPGSDSSVLLVDLQKALRAKTAPRAPLTKTSIHLQASTRMRYNHTEMPDSPFPIVPISRHVKPDLSSRTFDLPFPKGPLYHYTTQQGFLGIIRSGRFWATHTRFLNDPGEILYGQQILNSCLSTVIQSVHYPEIRQVLESLPDALSALTSASSYITCFTETRDAVVHWSWYGEVAIELDSTRLCSYSKQPFLIRVCYDPDAQISLVRNHISSWTKNVESSLDSRSGRLSDVIRAMTPDLIARMYCVLPSLKSPQYSHEAEWRLVVYITDVSQILFRPSAPNLSPSLTPYVELNVGSKLPISGLVVRPNCLDFDRTRLSLGMFLTQAGYVNCPVKLSCAPYVYSPRG